jgi:low affinity Fe/Cu permease
MERAFARFATAASDLLGHAYVFIIALLLVLLWAVSGPFFAFSDTWQLVINTATTITTGLMVFIIQNTQNRDARAIHIKLDELLRAVKGARGELADAEDRSEAELKSLKVEMMEESNHGHTTHPAASSSDRRTRTPRAGSSSATGGAPSQRHS